VREDLRIADRAIPISLDGDREVHQVHVVHGVGAIQPYEGRVRIAQPGIHEGERIRRNVPVRLAECCLS